MILCADCSRPTKAVNEYRGKIICNECYEWWLYEDALKNRLRSE